jgi:hypothetical protein
MRPLDWFVLVGCLTLVVGYGTWRGHGSNTVKKYMLADNSMPWYAIAFSIMATQASAITFISTTGQSYVDGMRFVQFYFGLPIAMIILSVTLVPLFHRAKVYTALSSLVGITNITLNPGGLGTAFDSFAISVPMTVDPVCNGAAGHICIESATITPVPTPEPSSAALLLLGIGLVLVMRKPIAQGLRQAT